MPVDQESSAGPTDAGGDATAAGSGSPTPEVQDDLRQQDQPTPKIIRPTKRAVIVMSMVAVAGILAVLYAWQLWPFSSGFVRTENAYVRGQITVLAPQVNGYVTEVLVQDFESVEADQPIIRIDDRTYRQRVEQARGQLAASRYELDNMAQTLASDQATLASRNAELYATRAEYDRARADEARVNELASRGSVSTRERDQIRATARAAAANVKRSEAAIDIAKQTVKATGVSRGGRQAQVEISEAALRLAEIDLANTTIRAPRTGLVSEVSVRQGQYVAAGSQLLYLVPDHLWIIANYKETQTHLMQSGQRVAFAVDGLDNVVLTGRVERLAPATGSEFSVLRADNASGNFTKVVQRIPVRIAIDPDQPLATRLRPGMSVVATVDTDMSTAGENR